MVVQGITGKFGSYHSQLLREYGTRWWRGSRRGRALGGGRHPVYDSLAEAKDERGAEAVAVLCRGRSSRMQCSRRLTAA